ncbi:MAG TPA: hypothetical protein VG944_06785 [Fimbriimonas sp.]|nr:hypothetical protein [Fimbriimonas sp.]
MDQLEHYLASYKSPIKPQISKWEYGLPALASLGVSALLFTEHAAAFVAGMCLVGGVAFGYKAWTIPAKKPPSPHDELFARADEVVRKLQGLSQQRRIGQTMHPGVALTLNECAGFWRRILNVCENKMWSDAGVQPHWKHAREDWRTAADLGMAEALILADTAITLTPKKPRMEEVVQDVLETYVFPRSRGGEPLPPSFEPLRELAEKLKLLASEVEKTTRRIAEDENVDAAPTASRRLEEVLGQLRAIQQAEEELHEEIR